MKLRGVVLAGGSGSRLDPLTRVTNKHLLPVYDKPVIFYPLLTLREMGIDEVLVVTGDKSAGEIMRLLGNGKEFGFKRLNYAFQDGGDLGIANALDLAEDFSNGDKLCVILGDNVLTGGSASLLRIAENFKNTTISSSAKIILSKVPDPERFGCPVFSRKDRARAEEEWVADINPSMFPLSQLELVRIEEKPKKPMSSFAVIGVYFYDSNVFEIIKGLEPSDRGEFEITDVNNTYLDRGRLQFDIFEGDWTDTGTFESLIRASNLVYEQKFSRDKEDEI